MAMSISNDALVLLRIHTIMSNEVNDDGVNPSSLYDGDGEIRVMALV